MAGVRAQWQGAQYRNFLGTRNENVDWQAAAAGQKGRQQGASSQRIKGGNTYRVGLGVGNLSQEAGSGEFKEKTKKDQVTRRLQLIGAMAG